jgi:hypothetical protein
VNGSIHLAFASAGALFPTSSANSSAPPAKEGSKTPHAFRSDAPGPALDAIGKQGAPNNVSPSVVSFSLNILQEIRRKDA